MPSTGTQKTRTLMPPPKLNLTRFHGVFAPNHALRRQITQTKPQKALSQIQHQHKTTSYRLTWAERLKRVFHIDIERCEHCRGKVSIIATIKDPIVIKKILDHLDAKQSLDSIPAYQLPHAQAPPSQYFL